MTQYIDKATVVEEVERRIEAHKETLKNCGSSISEMALKGSMSAYQSLLHFLDTLKVKELDLDEAARKWEDKVYLEKGWQDEYGTPHAPFSEIGNAFREGAKFILEAQKGGAE